MRNDADFPLVESHSKSLDTIDPELLVRPESCFIQNIRNSHMARNPSPIETLFRDACAQEGIYFNEETQVGRYRADFLDKSRRLIIELDGHAGHKSKDARTYDAQRDRYLHREGYTVLRFTGSEIYSQLSRCVKEVQQTLLLMTPQPSPAGAIYIDWQFLDRRVSQSLRLYKMQYPKKHLAPLTLSALLEFTARYLDLTGRHDVHLFGTASSFSTSTVDIDALKLQCSHNALFNITEHQEGFIAISLVEHLTKCGTRYDFVLLIADDNAYPVLLDNGRTVDVLFRLGDESTSMVPVSARRWQDIAYVIGYSIGLETHEL